MGRRLAHLDHPDCDTACYRCLKAYRNQRYHDQLHWPLAISALEALAEQAPQECTDPSAWLNDPRPWLEAYAAGVGSPLELKFLRLFEQHSFNPTTQCPIVLREGAPAVSVADFGCTRSRVAIYIDGASVHVGHRLRRDRIIRQRMMEAEPRWNVIELRARDLARGASLVNELKAVCR